MRLALATLVLIGLTSAAHPLTPELFPEITLQGGLEQVLPDTGITLMLTRVEDSRCPAGLDCVWEGMIRVRLTVSTPTAKLAIVLCNQCDDASGLATAAGQTFGLIGLAPSTEELAKLGRAPDLSDYAVTVNYGPAD
ncbi:hypothetical protein L2E76_11330 [Planktothrix agardhii 1811]|nr:hypothetical protein [Planktothrix agardhii 1811]